MVFLVARRDGEPVGCGGLRRLDPRTAEVKRMYVVPARRGTGVAAAVLRALEDEARAAGMTRLVLETGTGQRAGMRFYEREGFTPCACWGAYADSPISRCYERDISATA